MSVVLFGQSRSITIRCTAVLLFSISGMIASHAQTGLPPFVAGFERFTRHGDLGTAESGELLVAELSCVSCHASGNSALSPKRGPTLAGAANRFSSQWLREYLASPTSQKPGTTMPHMLAGLDPEQQQAAINRLVAFLGTQKKPFETVRATGAVAVLHEFWNQGDADRGRDLYHTTGCVACHEPDPDQGTSRTKPSAVDEMINQLDPEELQELGLHRAARRVDSVPHGDLVAKYTRRSLTMFLLRPESFRSGSRMPNMRLTPSEAADIAAHLLVGKVTESGIGESAVDPRMIEEGRALFVELQCRNCHEVTGVAAPRMAMPWDRLDPRKDNTCLADPVVGMPDYGLDALQIEAITARIQTRESHLQSLPGQQVHGQMVKLNCYACHQRKTVLSKGGTAELIGGVGRYRKAYFEMVEQVDLGDEGRLPPPLTGVGNKLQSKVLKSVFEQRTPAYRRHMKARMPAYQAQAVQKLIEKLPDADRKSEKQKSESAVFGKPNAGLLSAGHELSGTGCVECHHYRGESLPGVIGIDLAGITTRVRPEWFHDFVIDPGALKNRTRMPTFFPDGKSSRPDLLEGDVEDQVAALWFYLKDLANQPLPEKIEKVRSQNYELRPKERPVVLRSFMRDAGTHAIAVGFPEQIHYSFDAEKIQLTSAWKGRFLDARGTWFERFTPPAEPLGESLVQFAQGPPFAVLDENEAVWPEWGSLKEMYLFQGYRLDDKGVPVFQYRFGKWQIQERIEPVGQDGLRRHWDIQTRQSDADGNLDASGSLNLCIHQGRDLIMHSPNVLRGGGLQVTVVSVPQAETRSDARIVKGEKTDRWILPLSSDDQCTIAVEYKW